MYCIEKEENVLNLLDWLNSEVSLWFCVRKDVDYYDNLGEYWILWKFDNCVMNSEMFDDDVCLLGCEVKYFFVVCLKY